MSLITTHVLDTAKGEPAGGIEVELEYSDGAGQPWTVLSRGKTDVNGRLQNLLPSDHALQTGIYRLRFDTSTRSPFFPDIAVQFIVSDAQQHYHIPLLLSCFGYATYRGS